VILTLPGRWLGRPTAAVGYVCKVFSTNPDWTTVYLNWKHTIGTPRRGRLRIVRGLQSHREGPDCANGLLLASFGCGWPAT